MQSDKTTKTKPTKLPSAFKLLKPSKDALFLNLPAFIGLAILPALMVLPIVLLLMVAGAGNTEPNDTFQTVGAFGAVVVVLFVMWISLLTYSAGTYLQLASAKGKKV